VLAELPFESIGVEFGLLPAFFDGALGAFVFDERERAALFFEGVKRIV
jgi:hypothetical protein